MVYLLFACALPAAFAAMPCPPLNNLIDASTAVTADVLKVAQIDDADRRLAKEYAAEHMTTEDVIKQRYAATGDLTCTGLPRGEANVTLVGDVITTAAHSIFGSKSCGAPKQKISDCKIITEINGEKFEYEVDTVISTGWTCGTSDVDHGATDWAVLRLKQKVDPRIKPYKIAPDYAKSLSVGKGVMAVAKSVDFPKNKETNILNKPRHYGDCESRGNTSYDSARWATTNCDLSPGSSGGALLTRGSDPALVGIHTGLVASGEACTVSKDKKVGPSSDCWFTGSAAVVGDLRESLEEIERTEGRTKRFDGGSGTTL